MKKNDNDSGMDSNLTLQMTCYVHGWVVVFKSNLLGSGYKAGMLYHTVTGLTDMPNWYAWI